VTSSRLSIVPSRGRVCRVFAFHNAVRLGAAVIVLWTAAVHGGQLTPAEERGKQLYQSGTSPAGSEVAALLGRDGAEVSASLVPCVNCHRSDGRGRAEGGIVPSDLRWAALTTPYGVVHPNGRHHPPYTQEFLERAITEGLDPSGNRLDWVMPRYRMRRGDLADLTAYLKKLGTVPDPGVSEAEIRIGVVLPPVSPHAALGQDVRTVLEAYADDMNGRGGVYGRRITLRFSHAPDFGRDLIESTRRFITSERLFALLATFVGRPDDGLPALARELGIPVIVPVAEHVESGSPVNPYVFYLYSGVRGQALALARFADRRAGAVKRSFVIVAPPDAGSQDIAREVMTDLARSGWTEVHRLDFPDQAADRGTLLERLRELADRGLLLLLVQPREANVLLEEMSQVDWTADTLIPGALAPAGLVTASRKAGGRVFVAYPTLPRLAAEARTSAYRRLDSARRLPATNRSAQLSVLTCAELLLEGLRRAGRGTTTRERLIEVFVQFDDVDTGMSPPVTFGPNRRVGAAGAYIAQVDFERQTLVPIGEWIEVR